METSRLNLLIGALGLILMLTGLLLLSKPMLATPLTGVGGSILATTLVNWIITRRLASLPINSIIEALARKTDFMRTRQEAELTFTLENGCVRLKKLHRYYLRNPSHFVRSRKVSMYTDVSPDNSDVTGGFEAVIEPDGTTLEGDLLANYVIQKDSKHIFRKTYDLQPGDSNSFEFRSFDCYRTRDRLIWTVQDLSDGFRVRIKNRTGRRNAFKVKVNHHREREIQDQMKRLDLSDEIIFEFNAEILPYQGFEIMWDLSE